MCRNILQCLLVDCDILPILSPAAILILPSALYCLSYLTLYAPNIILQYVHQPTRCTRFCLIRLYFLLDALHVSDCISPSSGATFISCTSHLVYAGICRYHTYGCCVAIATQQPHVSAYTGIYQM